MRPAIRDLAASLALELVFIGACAPVTNGAQSTGVREMEDVEQNAEIVEFDVETNPEGGSVAEASPESSAYAPVPIGVSDCDKDFYYTPDGHGSRLWSGYFTNCRHIALYVRADLAHGPDPQDKLVEPGHKATWTNQPITGTGTTFRKWKACRYSRCP